jgi:para-aminobenzoate synthetase/4-amino-4-deoxychorismate lyase
MNKSVINIKEIFQLLKRKTYSAFFFTPPVYDKAKSYIFQSPKQVIKINSSNFEKSLDEIDKKISAGAIGYSVMNYETGFLFEQKLSHLISDKETLSEFVFFNKRNFKEINSEKIIFDFKKNFTIKNFRLNTSKKEYVRSLEKIKNYIKAGDTYQVNFTVKGKFNFEGDLCSLFQTLIFNQSAKYIAVIHLPEKFIISISPELFFAVRKNKIISRPMKGTSHRGFNLISDVIAKQDLKKSEKNKAENVMIVDLMRNDLGRLSKFGSVKVIKLFEVEKYETVFQMISEIKAKLRSKTKLSDVIKNIFPCGSVTGAPKIRTMEIISEIEKEKRNVYTGSIGIFTKDKITFNVAIRTLLIDKKTNKGEIGLGSGIVWDSDPNKEFDEVKLKSKFLTSPQEYFEIFETILIEKQKPFLIKEHIERMKNAAEFFLFKLDEKEIKYAIDKTIEKTDAAKNYKLKIKLSKYGSVSTVLSELSPTPLRIKVIVSKSKVNSKEKHQYFKTTNRKLYDDELKHYSKQGYFEVIYFNERNELAEGSFTNIFIKRNSRIFTPPISSGILNGVYRNYLLQKNSEIRQTTLTLNDLINADEIFLTNSVRGIINIDELYLNDREYISYTQK